MSYRGRSALASMRLAELAALKQSSGTPTLARFKGEVWKYWRENGRHSLPWRKTSDPYRILVSEVMLQQTQVLRVLEKYQEFLKTFPTVRTLAKASLADVIRIWSGMGYNRRAKFLRDAAKIIVENHKGKVPKDYASLRALPGVGDYTARAVRVFAFNEPDVLIETNVRAAYIHFFYSSVLQNTAIADTELVPLATDAAKRLNPREWHWALMDYGVHVKKLHDNPTRRSAHYAMQKPFEGSLRQVRGAVLSLLKDGPYGDLGLSHELPFDGKKIREALRGLASDGLVVSSKGSWRIA